MLYIFQTDKLAAALGVSKGITCSALNGDGVNTVFEEAIRAVIHRKIPVHGTGNVCCCHVV